MKPLYDFIVHIENLFEKEQGTETFTLIRDTRWDDFEGRIPYGTVTGIPDKHDTPAEIGDTIVFHHHISQEPDKYSVGADLYRVSYDPESYQGQSYCVIKKNGDIHMLGDWVFLEAYEVDPKEEDTTEAGLFLGYKKEEDKKEAVVYCEGPGTESLSIKKGDTVGFSRNSDYEIQLPNGDKVYRCKPNDLEYVRL